MFAAHIQKICTFPKQKPSKLHIFSKCYQHISSKNVHPPSVGIIYPIFLKISANFCKICQVCQCCPQSRLSSKLHVLKVACPQSRMSSKSSVIKVACPQSRLSSKSRPQSRVLNVARPHCPIVGHTGTACGALAHRCTIFLCIWDGKYR